MPRIGRSFNVGFVCVVDCSEEGITSFAANCGRCEGDGGRVGMCRP